MFLFSFLIACGPGPAPYLGAVPCDPDIPCDDGDGDGYPDPPDVSAELGDRSWLLSGAGILGNWCMHPEMSEVYEVGGSDSLRFGRVEEGAEYPQGVGSYGIWRDLGGGVLELPEHPLSDIYPESAPLGAWQLRPDDDGDGYAATITLYEVGTDTAEPALAHRTLTPCPLDIGP